MAKSETCDVCGRAVTITTDRGEYVTGLQGYEYSDGSVRCEGNSHGPADACLTTDSDGNVVEIKNGE